MPVPVTISTPNPDQIPAVCRVLFRHLPEPERSLRSARVSQLFASGEFDPKELLFAEVDGELLGAGFVHLEPGNQASVWLPGVLAGPHRDTIETALAEAYRSRFLTHGVKFGQLLLPESASSCPPALEQIGFRFVTRLEYLLRRLTHRDRTDPSATGLTVIPVEESRIPGELLLATYEGSRDVPELNDTRSIAEILAGYGSHQPDNPIQWYRLEHDAQPVGVLFVLVLKVQPEVVELGYVGLVPEARGHGLGRQAVEWVIQWAARTGAGCLSVTVDERNTPAVQLYRQQRFTVVERQSVYLWKPEW